MASSAIKGIMNFFKGKESAKEEKAEKKLSPAQYRKGEKAEGVKSTSAKKSTGSAAAKKTPFPVKKTAAKKK